MSNNEEENKSWWSKYGWKILLILALFAFIYYLFQSVKQRSKETEEESEERVNKLLHRQRKLKRIIETKRNQKRWLDWAFNVTYSIVRFLIIGIGVLGFYSANWFFEGDISLERYLSWGAFLALCFTALTFLFFGYPSTIPAALKEVKPKLQNSIYGKYLGIDDSIKDNENEILKIDSEIKKYNE